MKDAIRIGDLIAHLILVTYLSTIDNPSYHSIFHISRVQVFKHDFILRPQRRRLINLNKEFRERSAALLLRKAVVISIALNDKFPALVFQGGM